MSGGADRTTQHRKQEKKNNYALPHLNGEYRPLFQTVNVRRAVSLSMRSSGVLQNECSPTETTTG
jgi:hypothetical protein